MSYFRLESTKLADFNRACRLEDDILRSLTLRVDARLVEALVAHAKGERVVARPVEESAAEKPSDDEEAVTDTGEGEWVAEEEDGKEEVR